MKHMRNYLIKYEYICKCNGTTVEVISDNNR